MSAGAKPPWALDDDDAPPPATGAQTRPIPPQVPGFGSVSTPGAPDPRSTRPVSTPGAPDPRSTRPMSNPGAPDPRLIRAVSTPGAPDPRSTRPLSNPGAPDPRYGGPLSPPPPDPRATRPTSAPAAPDPRSSWATAPGGGPDPRATRPASTPGAPDPRFAGRAAVPGHSPLATDGGTRPPPDASAATETLFLPAGDDAETKVLQEGLEALHVALGHARLYGPRHRETDRAVARSWDALARLTERVGPVPLQSSDEGMAWNRALVHPEDDAREGIGRLLHREGIASLLFAPGLERDELVRLLSVLRVNLSLPQFEEETLESLLWQAGMEHITFQAVTALSEAEALSARAVREAPPGIYTRDVLREVLEVRVGGTGERRNIKEIVGEDVLRRAVENSRLSDLGPAGELSQNLAEQARWTRRFADEGTEDAEEISRIRDELAAERPGDVIARTISVLLRVAAANRAELPPAQAIALARAGIEDAFDRGDTIALAGLAESLPRALSDPELVASPAWVLVQPFVGEALPPARIARLLLTLGPDQADERSLSALVSQLPDDTFVMVLDGVTSQLERGGGNAGEQARMIWLQEMLAAVARPRLEGWMAQVDAHPPERLVLMARTLRGGARSDVVRQCRRRLLDHGRPQVREAALRWYLDELPRDEGAAILPALLDRQPSIRQAAADVIARHRPYEAGRWLKEQVGSPTFAQQDPATRRDLLVLLGRVGGDGVMDFLVGLLEKEIPAGRERDLQPQIEGAALAIAAIGSLGARTTLRRLSSAGNPLVRRSCEAALRRLEGGGR